MYNNLHNCNIHELIMEKKYLQHLMQSDKSEPGTLHKTLQHCRHTTDPIQQQCFCD